ncbi:hypothetical protein Tco_1306865, partial [Tanacetum coccineum]
MANHCYWELITSGGWFLVLAVLTQMAHLVANITFASTSFLPLVLLSTIIVTIVGVAIVATGIVVESSSIVKLSFVVV